MLEIFDLLKEIEDLLHILFFLVALDLSTGLVKSKLSKTTPIKRSSIELWQKISNFILILICSIIDTILKKNGISFEFNLSQLFSCLIIISECKNVIENLGETEVTELIENLIKVVFETINEKLGVHKKKQK